MKLIDAAWLVIIGAVVATEGYQRFVADRHARAVIIDSWWARDYARSACQMQGRSGCDMDVNIGPAEAEWGRELTTKMSVDKNCAGVVVHRFDIRSDGAKAMAEIAKLQKGPHMTLIPNYTTDREQDVYWSTGKNQEFAGHGSVDEIARDVCALAANEETWK